MKKITLLFVVKLFTITYGVYSQQVPTILPDDGLRVSEMKISDNGKRLIADYENYTVVWDIEKREMVQREPRSIDRNSPVRAVNQDGSLLAIGNMLTLDGLPAISNRLILSVYNAKNNELLKRFKIFELARNPNERSPDRRSTTLRDWEQETFK